MTEPQGERLTAAEWFGLPDGAIVHLPAFSGWTTVIVRGGYCDVIDAYNAAEVGERYARTSLAPRDLADESPRLLVHAPPAHRYREPEPEIERDWHEGQESYGFTPQDPRDAWKGGRP